MIFVGLLIRNLFFRDLPPHHRMIHGAMMIAAMYCMGSSTVYHIILPVSQKTSEIALNCDMVRNAMHALVRVCRYIRVCIGVCVRLHARVCMRHGSYAMYTSMWSCTCAHVHMCVCKSVCVFVVCVCVRVRAGVCVVVYVCMYDHQCAR